MQKKFRDFPVLTSNIRIRPAVKEDLDTITRLRKQALLEAPVSEQSHEDLLHRVAVLGSERTLRRIAEECVLVATSADRVVASICLDLDRGEMLGLCVDRDHQNQGVGKRLVTELERMAVQYGMWELRTEAPQGQVRFYQQCQYHQREGSSLFTDERTGQLSLPMIRTFPQRQTQYGARIRKLLEKIGISPLYGRERRLKLQHESKELATIGHDRLGREQMMQPEAAMAWYDMRNAARDDGVRLEVASSFRSVGYQVQIIERKKLAGQSIEEILRVSAAPGYSEHHTGCAIDISCPNSPPFEECFENTEAFEWLTECAADFDFSLSYPRNNRHGIAYEPWHWAWKNSLI